MAHKSQELKLGDLTVIADAHSTTFYCGESDRETIRIPNDKLGELISFLNNISPKSSDTRLGFRVPLVSNLLSMGVSPYVELFFKEKAYEATPVDLSLTGCLIIFPKADEIGLMVGDQVDIRFRLGNKNALLQGKVTRIDNHQKVGIFFTDSIVSGRLEPSENLWSVFRSAWFRRIASVDRQQKGYLPDLPE